MTSSAAAAADILRRVVHRNLSSCEPRRKGSLLSPEVPRSLLDHCLNAEVHQSEDLRTALTLRVNQSSECRSMLQVDNSYITRAID